MRYLDTKPFHASEQPYDIKDGVIIEPEPAKVRLRDRWEAAERFGHTERIWEKVEEARWASLSGPVTVRKVAT